MKKTFLLIFILIFTLKANATVIEAGVSIEHVPKELLGSWRVNAKLEDTNSPRTFRPQSIDFWNLSRTGDRIKLDLPTIPPIQPEETL